MTRLFYIMYFRFSDRISCVELLYYGIEIFLVKLAVKPLCKHFFSVL